jgi:hypothetical protein
MEERLSMAKSLFYRLFGLGKTPAAYAAQLQAEGVVLMDEGVKGSVTYIDFHRPGKSSGWERRWFTASVALTKSRLLALNASNPIINVPLTDERLRQVRFTLEDEETLCVAFDAALFQPTWSGKVEYRFRTEQAQRFLESLGHPVL